MTAHDRWLLVEENGDLWLIKREGAELHGRIVSREGLRPEFPRLYQELLGRATTGIVRASWSSGHDARRTRFAGVGWNERRPAMFDGDGDERAQRREARRQIRVIFDDAFAREGLPTGGWPDDWPAAAGVTLAPPPSLPAAPAEPRKPVVTFLGTFEIPAGAALMVPTLDDHAVATLQETAFETEQRRLLRDGDG